MKPGTLVLTAIAMAILLAGCSQPVTSTSDAEVGGVDAAAAGGEQAPVTTDPVPVEPQAAKTGLQLEVLGFSDGGTIPDSMAFCIPAAKDHVTFGANQSPELKWSQVPQGTKSFVLICKDSDVPSLGEDVNQEGRTVSKDLARTDFFHWVLADMTPGLRGLAAGQDSDKVTIGGKAPGPTDYGARGINDYTHSLAADKKMRGEYGGYDGPCPPWNDERMHSFHFTLYALSVDSLKMDGSFDGKQVLAAMEGKILDKASWTGNYTLNKALRGDAPAVPAPEAEAPSTGGDPG